MTPSKMFLPVVFVVLFSCKKESTVTSANNNIDADIYAPSAVVKIGKQRWTTKDLTTSTYRNGDPIPEVKNAAAWAALTTGAWCWYRNDSVKWSGYGKLYNWFAVNDARGLAPAGYHIPSDSEWTKLTDFLGGEPVAGGKMKETGTKHWLAINQDATNSSGFTAFGGGLRATDGTFHDLKYSGYWWSSTENNTEAWARQVPYYSGAIFIFSYSKIDGYSIRCIKD